MIFPEPDRASPLLALEGMGLPEHLDEEVGAGTASPSLLPSMFVEALRVAQGAQSLILRTNPSPHDPQFGIPQDLGVGALTVPLTRAGTYRILYGDLDEAMTLSAQEVLASTDNPQALAPRIGGTIVLIGSSAPGLFDLRATPLGTIVPGVSMHAQAIAGVLSGVNLARPDWTTGMELMMMIVAGALIIVTALFTRPLVAAAILGIVVVAMGTGSWWAFSEQRLLIDASFPILLTLLTYGAVTVPVLVGTDRRQRFIRNAFAHYLAEPVLARLEADPDALKLDGERRSVTIMFMDVRGFTSRSEHMQPTQAVELLNTLLDPLSEAVLIHEGTIDKFMGDGMMAFWNAPLDQTDHAARAVRAAKAMVNVVADVNAELSPGEKPLAIGIGLHTGEAFVGNMGSKRRFAYSAIGDPVNLAARVEALAGSLGEALLITQETLDHAKESQADLAADFTSAGDHQGGLFVMFLGVLGFSLFNFGLYGALNFTTALNVSIEQSAFPSVVMLLMFIVYREKISWLQGLGVLMTIIGIAITVSQGSLERLLALQFNIGDVIMMGGVLVYSIYSILLRYRPKLPWHIFMMLMSLGATIVALPPALWELWSGNLPEASWKVPALLLYIIIFPSLLSQVFWVRGVELIGPSRASVFINLVPVFGSGLAVLIIGEVFAIYHAAGIVFVIGGVMLAEWAASAETYTPETDIYTFVITHLAKLAKTKTESPACILIDEAQFLTEDQVWQLARIVDDIGIPVMAYGLRVDFAGKLFPGSRTLLAIADEMREVRTICWCGKKATMVVRVGEESKAITGGAQVEIGGNDRYISLCRKHWRQAMDEAQDGAVRPHDPIHGTSRQDNG
eukprot:g17586.t1